MTLLPPALPSGHGIVKEKEEEANYMHNWLYSVVPATVPQKRWVYGTDGVSKEVTEYPLLAYLTGFDRECRKAFSIPIPTGESYLETQLEVPVYGCVKPGTYR